MTPEQVEACARRAYQIMQANVNESTPWDASKNKTHWIDMVTSYARTPGNVTNLQEHCVAQAYKEYLEANPQTAPKVEDRPLIIPPIAAAAAETPPAEGEQKSESTGQPPPEGQGKSDSKTTTPPKGESKDEKTKGGGK